MAQTEGDFKKGEADGAKATLAVRRSAANAVSNGLLDQSVEVGSTG